MACGVVIVDKPSGWTSQDVVSKLRGTFHERRIGHGGTLDPMATGVLPVFVGPATRAVTYFESAEKTYLAGLRLGIETDTQDSTGRILRESGDLPSEEELREALSRFVGEQMQVPPMYSAVKIGGQKLYELARRGESIDRPARRITVFSIELLETHLPDCLLKIHCSKGTYVRTLCHDLGAALGCGGVMASLRRLCAGRFRLEDAVGLDELTASETPEKYLMPLDAVFSDVPRVEYSPRLKPLLLHGNPVPAPALCGGLYRVYDENQVLSMLARCENGVLRVDKFFL